MIASKIRSSALPLAVIILVTTFWWWSTQSTTSTSHVLPSPWSVCAAAIQMACNGELWADITSSFLTLTLGYTLGATLGIITGLLTGRFDSASKTLGLVLQLLRPLPVIALVPFAITFVGIDQAGVYLVGYGVLMICWINTDLAVRSTNQELIWAADSLGLKGVRRAIQLYVCCNAGKLIAGLRAALAVGIICLVAAEMSGASAGLAYRISLSHLIFRADKMVASLIFLGAMGALVDFIFSRYMGRICPWVGKISA